MPFPSPAARRPPLTFGLFQNVQNLDLIWNNVLSTSADSTSVSVVRGFNLTVVFNPGDIERVES